MKLLLYIVLLLAVCFLPVQPTDVGKLIPVEVIALSEGEGELAVRTDTGDLGRGSTLQEAFGDLRDTAPGTIYLDTAAYLLLEPGTEDLATALTGYLKPDTKVYLAVEGIQLEGIAEYLSAHHPGLPLKDALEVSELPVLTEKDGRYWIK